jgi:hypothetical protein
MSRNILVLSALVLSSPAIADDKGGPLFNGKDLTGFRYLKEYWSVKEGAIVGSSHPDGIKFNTFLVSEKEYGDFELSFKVKLTGEGCNSGVQIRSILKDEKTFAVWGPQCDMARGYWGSLFGEHFGGKKPGDHQMLKAAAADVVKRAVKEGEFNDYSIRAVGKKVTIKINGETTVDTELDILPDKGVIAFQVHVGKPMEVIFKDIVFKEIK